MKINDKPITIYSDSYIKRTKVYDSYNKWIDTKPILVNNIDKNLIPYKDKELVVYKANKQVYKANKQYVINNNLKVSDYKLYSYLKIALSYVFVQLLIILSAIAYLYTLEKDDIEISHDINDHVKTTNDIDATKYINTQYEPFNESDSLK